MSDFLLELRSEEIPARMQAGARADLERLFREQMAAAGVSVGEVVVWSTPRRLALIAKGLPDATEAVSEEAKGPPEGAPDAAIEGFCRKAGVTRESLELRDVKGRNTYFAVIDKPGRATKGVLAEAIPAIVRETSDEVWGRSGGGVALSLTRRSPGRSHRPRGCSRRGRTASASCPRRRSALRPGWQSGPVRWSLR